MKGPMCRQDGQGGRKGRGPYAGRRGEVGESEPHFAQASPPSAFTAVPQSSLSSAAGGVQLASVCKSLVPPNSSR